MSVPSAKANECWLLSHEKEFAKQLMEVAFVMVIFQATQLFRLLLT